ncbi:MAG: hypothetical protein FWC36_09755 [Spirochaetes bacterium]|nr:hypothetical protein [Spirochaetota bacterium]
MKNRGGVVGLGTAVGGELARYELPHEKCYRKKQMPHHPSCATVVFVRR